MKRLVFDIEADGLLDTVSRIWCIVVRDLDSGERLVFNDQKGALRAGSILAGVDALRNASRLYAHNGLDYDYRAILKVTGIDIGRTKIYDTMVLGRLFNPERRGGHNLESYGDEFGLPKGDHSDFSCWSPEMQTYCVRDVDITWTLARKLEKGLEGWGESPRLELDVSWIITLQRSYGFALDVRSAEELAAQFLDERMAIEKELLAAFPPIYVSAGEFTPKRDNTKSGYIAGAAFTRIVLQEFNPGSNKQIAERLTRKHGWKPKKFTPEGAPAVDEAVLKSLSYPEAALLAKYARVNKLYTQVAGPPKKNGTGGGWLHHVRPDGRIHGYVNSNGAVTGRMTHSRPNSANIDTDHRIRALWIAEPGKQLVGCDAEGLELRMLAHYLGAWDGGAYARAVVDGKKEDETDAHSRTRKIVGLFKRDNAKTFIYALIYGGGDGKLGMIVIADAKESDKPKPKGSAATIGKNARGHIEEGIVGLGKLKKAILKQVRVAGWIRGLDGRKLFVRSQHSALNTALQGAGAVVMKKALVILFDRLTDSGLVHGVDYGFVCNCHDEWQIECRPDIAGRVGEMAAHAMSDAGLYFRLRVPLSGAYQIGKSWAETH